MSRVPAECPDIVPVLSRVEVVPAEDLSTLKVNALEGSPGLEITPAEWTGPLVGHAMIAAFKTLNRLPEQGRPRGYGQAMPNYRYEELDLWYQKQQIAEERRRNEAQRNRVVVRPTTLQITRMYMAFDWIAAYRRVDPDAADRIQEWAHARAHHGSLDDVCARRNWSIRTMNRIRNRGLSAIADTLNQDSVIPF